jgi:DNA-binding NtrC family response regulator
MAGTSRGQVLVVDDDAMARGALATLLRDDGFTVETAADGFKALGKVEENEIDVVVSDLKMPAMDGLELMSKLRLTRNPPEFVCVTAFGDVSDAVHAMRAGAADYLLKPLNIDELVIVLTRLVEKRRLVVEAAELRARVRRGSAREMIGSSPVMEVIQQTIDRVAPTRSTVLITGESGTGKELVATAIHERSPRAARPFIKVHCAALAESLLESELFGHEKGAFTGAVARREGRFSAADGGTLFLDEIGEISPSIQVKLLRFLQEHEFERVGADRPIRVDVRIVAATNRDLTAMVKEGRFREDLYYRLNVVQIETPPLRARPGDIATLAMFFFERFTADLGKPLEGFSVEAVQALTAHPWPGNVRELENAVERAVVMSAGPRVEVGDLPPSLRGAAAEPRPATIEIPGATMRDIERYAIVRTLEATRGSTAKAAAMLGISPRSIQYKLQEYRAEDDGQPRPPRRRDSDAPP